VRFFVGITDREWFDFLSRLNGVDEVNFWQPSGQQQFRALQIGEPFLFKLHSPDDYIVGGGFFPTAWVIVCSKFGQDLPHMRLDGFLRNLHRIEHQGGYVIRIKNYVDFIRTPRAVCGAHFCRMWWCWL
jgi:hypothetical protein